MILNEKEFGKTESGIDCKLFEVKLNDGSLISLSNLGAAIVNVCVPDKNGNIEEVNLGFDKASDYQKFRSFYGVTVGRFANRIANGKITIDGQDYQLTVNNGKNTLHSGLNAIDTKVWDTKIKNDEDHVKFIFSTVSNDGEDGFPGNLKVEVCYTISQDKEIRIDYKASTDKATVINLTNHAYFNLSGELKEDVLNHSVQIDADFITPVNEDIIPTGELRPVENTPFDFKKPRLIGERINEDYDQLIIGIGYDHNFVLNGKLGELRYAASVVHEKSGRKLEVFTTEPGVQLYTGNFMDGSHSGHGGKVYKHRHGFCLETQHFPDSPNQKNFPSTILRPGDIFNSTTIYKFSVNNN